MESEQTVILGLSVAGAAAALHLAEQGKPVTLIEIPGEIPLRARPMIWDTPLSQRDRKGADFETLVLRLLERHGARVERDLESLHGSLPPAPQFALRRFDQSEPHTVAAARLIYASDGAWNADPIPKGARDLISRGVSASAWIDATFHSGKSVAVAGAGDFAFEQLYWAGQCASELCWIHPESRAMISEDLMDRVELPVVPTLRTSEEVLSARREGTMLELSLSSGKLLNVHAVFFASPPTHEQGIFETKGTLDALRRAGAVIIGTADGAPWTHFNSQWLAGWEAGAQQAGASPAPAS